VSPADGAWLAAATYGLRYAAERQGLNLHTYNVEAMAEAAVHHALNTTQIITREDAEAKIEKVERICDQHLRRACAAEGARDRQMSKLQYALSAWPDRQAAEVLAKECGVLLLPEKEADVA
jgi:hypothetical protein